MREREERRMKEESTEIQRGREGLGRKGRGGEGKEENKGKREGVG